MNLDALRKRLEKTSTMFSIFKPEPWPPIDEGDILHHTYDRLMAEGVSLPDKPPGEPSTFLLERLASEIWSDIEIEVEVNHESGCEYQGR